MRFLRVLATALDSNTVMASQLVQNRPQPEYILLYQVSSWDLSLTSFFCLTPSVQNAAQVITQCQRLIHQGFKPPRWSSDMVLRVQASHHTEQCSGVVSPLARKHHSPCPSREPHRIFGDQVENAAELSRTPSSLNFEIRSGQRSKRAVGTCLIPYIS